MEKTIGIIGAGNMGQAILSGLLKTEDLTTNQLWVSDTDQDKLNRLKDQHQINTTIDNTVLISKCQIIILALKPYIIRPLIQEFAPQLSNKLIISIATGYTLNQATQDLGKQVKFCRAMPNTPALVGKGTSGLAPNKNISDEELSTILSIFNSFGQTIIVTEEVLNSAVTGLIGSGPALVYIIAEAMADAGVHQGLTRDQAMSAAIGVLAGSSQLLAESNLHPGQLKDMVCTPMGTTSELVRTAEKLGIRAAVNESIIAASKRSVEISKQS
ncbi:hypothetical protein AWM75_05990 [Aerococcus urinaehominis]|uniref:Pyrroline-5-carboxylate reductase n=1 Tax=Aerococcus urinaehominis TaxID=128944 RepID=A0A0X8FLN4_9LACT|nr:pyrroline-5-carboxylate reductase [Aerococcus urinaehominis]AMB99575.1 hypothetical protein AWM75_05990 [Aerococcus urinaehominis]SDM35695.1 pyrroline-5-carboxylate reductase [Aerococcus urinaehominis]